MSNYNFVVEKLICDKYYYDPLRQNFKPNCNGKLFECFRLRQAKNGSAKITNKQDIYKDGMWQYSNENEFNISNAEQFDRFAFNLGYKELLTIKNKRRYYKTKDYEIVLENVDNLGAFLEVEYKSKIDETKISTIRNQITEFIKNLGLNVSEELNCGKPELYIKRNKIKID